MLKQRILDAADSSDLATFERRLVEFAHEMDFGLAAAGLVFESADGNSEVISIGNVPSGFVELSTDPADIKRDPVIKLFKKLSTPFTYDQSTYTNEAAGDLWEQQAPFGYKNGIALAMHLPFNRHLLVGIDRDEALPSCQDELVKQLGLISLLVTHIQSTAIRLLTPTSGQFMMPKLTRREIEVLRVTAIGKSAWAVSAILGISECTVNFHMRNIHHKLDTSTKQQAVLKSSLLGLI